MCFLRHAHFTLELSTLKAFVSSKSMGFPTFFGLSGILLYFVAITPPKKFILSMDTLHLLKVLTIHSYTLLYLFYY